MRNIRSFIYNTLSIPGNLFGFLSSSRLRVLAYHDIENPTLFEKQIKFLIKHFDIIDLKTLNHHIQNQRPLPPKPLLITFDDGDFSVLKHGLPILKKYEIPACLFIITELIDTNREFWWNIFNSIYGKKKLNYFKGLSNQERITELQKIEYSGKRRQLTVEDLYELEQNGIRCCNHSHTHPLFDKCTLEELEHEFKKSKELFHRWGIPGDNIFAYPNGNFDEVSEKVLEANQIDLAFLFDHKLNNSKIHPLRISRIRVDSTTELGEFKVKVSGFHSLINQLRNGN
ncbi:Polysaccharide deacetylase [Salinimicrobium sediminis]|uniref:Polysaccharide deacetylase n=1 Tax=Salinimicrobium sediminis TaxID=1343891 RepID=A0A285X4T1_9FLAO|nr:polysaccharide deacetylase family protein [Salinimicrobium sediminis]SOC80325.1 Polysaccharide deacetylase [Salinimicrobium sediminis]